MSGIETEEHIENGEVEQPERALMPPLGEGNTNLLSQLRTQRSEIAEEATLDIIVPGYGDCLGLRLGPVPMREFALMIERSTRSKAPTQEADL